MTVSVNPQNPKRPASEQSRLLFALMIAVIAAIAVVVTAGCAGKTSARAGQGASAGFWSGGVDTGWYDEDENEFVINTAEELAGLAKLVNEEGKNFKGKTIRLGRDIVINDTAKWQRWASYPPAHQWTGIGTDRNRFKGTFDGGGRTISGVYIKKREDDQGLFGVIGSKGEVKRLNITASYVEGVNFVGILAGGNDGVITGCRTTGITVGDSIVGGLAGVNDGSIKSSSARGLVKGMINVGGFMGANREGAAAGNHSSASVSGDSIAGGFAGANWGGVINGNFSTGKVTGRADAGGFAGRDYGGLMRYNYYDRKASGQSDSGKGEGKTAAEMRSREFADSLNFIAGLLSVNAWVHSGKKHPVLSDKPADPAGADGYFASGKGTGDDPYIISSAEHLEHLSALVKMGARFSGKYIKLGRSIMLNDTANRQKWAAEPPAYAWMPIGTDLSRFDGTFDGGGHIISGVYVNNPENGGIALFGFTSKEATIRNVGVTASYFRGVAVVGGLVAYNFGRIINSYSAAVVTAEEINAGGLVGSNLGGTIAGCYATGAVSGGELVGGLVGMSAGGAISNCYSTGAVSTDAVKREDVCDGCSGIGGLMGLGNSAISACYTVSAVTGDTASGKLLGPLVGGPRRQIEISGGYFDSRTSGVKDNRKGSGKTTEQMKRKETFVGWDFGGVWAIDSAVNNGYPHLLKKIDESVIGIAKWPETIRANRDWYMGENHSQSEFTISAAEELAGLAELVNEYGVSFEGKTVKLGRDIIINDTANWRDWANNPPARKWIAIGTGKKDVMGFRGTFDGNGYAVSGVYIKEPKNYQGLFGAIENQGKIKRLRVTASYIEGEDYVGILVGSSVGAVTECYVSGIAVGDRFVGGLMGVNRGGIAAGSHSSAAVTGDSLVGGFAGSGQGGVISGNFSTGKVTGRADAGGFAGHGAMLNNYYDKETSGQSDSGKGEGKTTEEMRSAEFAGSLNEIAGILPINAWTHLGGEYPALSNEPADPASIDGYFAGGKGTGDDPYIINTKAQLENFSMLVNLGAGFSGKHIKLGRDIMLNDTANWKEWAARPPARAWAPAGIDANTFDGTFDGGGHAISGVYVNNPKNNFSGLFGKVSKGATIRNVGVTASYIKGYRGVGGLAGWNAGRIINCHSTAIVAGEDMFIGGLVGRNSFIGGLAGRNSGGAIIGCHATGAVSGNEYIGGLAGDNLKGGRISNSYSTGGVSGNKYIGGLAGLNAERSAINACYTIGAVTANNDSSKRVGPLAGYSDYCCKVSGSFFDSRTSGVEDNNFGKGRTTEQMKRKETFTGWDFDRIWAIDSKINNGYPHLSGELDESAMGEPEVETDGYGEN